MKRILVLKLGALGNVVLSMSAFAAIRQHHPGARITLLTTAPYAAWMAASPWFDEVLIDARPAWWDLPGVLRLRRMLRAGDFERVYDLQTSGRSSHYFRLFPRGARPEWSGIAPGCSHPDRDPNRDRTHDIDRQQGQLRQAGITAIRPPDLSWCRGDIARFGLPRRFALLAPGSAPHRPVKRWPAAHYRVLAAWLTQHGITPVVLGTAGERALADGICVESVGAESVGAENLDAASLDAEGLGAESLGAARPDAGRSNTGWPDARTPDADSSDAGTSSAGRLNAAATPESARPRDLTGQTSFGDLAELGRTAILAIGNDTGPMHLLAAAGCPSLVLFSRDSDPARCVPRTPSPALPVRVLRRDDLANLAPAEVIAAVAAMTRADAAEPQADDPSWVPDVTPIAFRATA